MFIYIYICIYVCLYVCMNVCMYVRMYVFIYVYFYVCIYVRIYLYICMCVCMYVYMYVCVHERERDSFFPTLTKKTGTNCVCKVSAEKCCKWVLRSAASERRQKKARGKLHNEERNSTICIHNEVGEAFGTNGRKEKCVMMFSTTHRIWHGRGW